MFHLGLKGFQICHFSHLYIEMKYELFAYTVYD